MLALVKRQSASCRTMMDIESSTRRKKEQEEEKKEQKEQ